MNIKYNLKKLEKDYGPLVFSDLLLIHREDKGWTQTRMAKELKLSKQKLCGFEKGRRLASVKTAVKWAKKLKQPPAVWVQVILQDQLRQNNLKFKVSIVR